MHLVVHGREPGNRWSPPSWSWYRSTPADNLNRTAHSHSGLRLSGHAQEQPAPNRVVSVPMPAHLFLRPDKVVMEELSVTWNLAFLHGACAVRSRHCWCVKEWDKDGGLQQSIIYTKSIINENTLKRSNSCLTVVLYPVNFFAKRMPHSVPDILRASKGQNEK